MTSQKFKFGKKSLRLLKDAHADWVTVLKLVIQVTNVDLGISETYRTTQRQNELFKAGKSKLDGITQFSKHNQKPSLAVDIYAFVNGKACYDKEHLSYLAGLIHGVSEFLYRRGEISHRVRWGGNWDMDGEILIDQSFDDRPHFELIRPKL